MENTGEQNQSNLFEEHVQYTPAASGTRFVNWLIDNLLMQFVLSEVTGRAVGYLIVNFFPDFARRVAFSGEKDPWDLLLVGYLIGIFNYLFYYTICEKAFKGYTLGKLITGTRAIREDGKELTFKDAFLRSLSRLVPFEALSGFGRPWHDAWTKTMVVQAR